MLTEPLEGMCRYCLPLQIGPTLAPGVLYRCQDVMFALNRILGGHSKTASVPVCDAGRENRERVHERFPTANSYSFIKLRFRLEFGGQSLFQVEKRTDPPGSHLIRVMRCIPPLATREATRCAAWTHAQEVCLWFKNSGLHLPENDRLEVIISLPSDVEDAAQLIFTGNIRVSQLPLLEPGFETEDLIDAGGYARELQGWDVGLFDPVRA